MTYPTIRYVCGDATFPHAVPAMIVHCCNHLGYWGAGFTNALDRRWPHVGKAYKTWAREAIDRGTPRMLGEVQYVEAEDDITVANLVGQDGIRGVNNIRPVRYAALGEGFQMIAGVVITRLFTRRGAPTLHMPRIGCGLAGGTWDKVEPLVQAYLCDRGIEVTVYDP